MHIRDLFEIMNSILQLAVIGKFLGFMHVNIYTETGGTLTPLTLRRCMHALTRLHN